MESIILIVLGVFIGLFVLLYAVATIVLEQRNKVKSELAEAAENILDLEQQRAEVERRLSLSHSPGADIAAKAPWQKSKVMNLSEFRVFQKLEALVLGSPNGHRVFSQVAYGGFLTVPEGALKDETIRAAYHAVARKRADFVIIDKRGMPVAVVEYQGSGHYQGNAIDRDQAKRVACLRAGVPFIEVAASGLTAGQLADLRSLIAPPKRKSIAAE